MPKNHSRDKGWFARYMKEYWQIYLLLVPAIVYFAVFHYAPMYGIQIAFKKYRARLGIWGSEWVGLKHFIQFVNDPWFLILMKNTLTLSFYSLVAGFPVPLILAFMINEVRSTGYKKTIQMITYAPHFLSGVVIAGMISLFFRLNTGIINQIIMALGGEQADWLSNSRAFKHLYVWSGVWQGAGWGTIIYLASLSSVDPAVVEAATIDGCTRFQRIIHIDFPTIRPTIVINLLLSLGGVLGSDSEKIILLQREITKMVSETFGSYTYNMGIRAGNFDYTAAAGLFQNVINLILLTCFNWVARKINETSLW